MDPAVTALIALAIAVPAAIAILRWLDRLRDIWMNRRY